MKLIAKNITLENVKLSTYWNLIAILVWNHYSEERYQEESAIEITEDWYGKCSSGGSYSDFWNDPNHFEEGHVRTLNAIVIKFTRSDYETYIYIYVDGNINCFGFYTKRDEQGNLKSPHYEGRDRNLDLTNWMMENSFIDVELEN